MDSRFTKRARFFIIPTIFIGIIAVLCFSKQSKLTLGETIAKNIEEHPSDWTFIDEVESYNKLIDSLWIKIDNKNITKDSAKIFLDNLKPINEGETWENKKCNIKLIVESYYSKCFKMISPDTIDISYSDCKLLIKAYDEFILRPKEIIEKQKEDSIANVIETQRLIKEKNIINKLCK